MEQVALRRRSSHRAGGVGGDGGAPSRPFDGGARPFDGAALRGTARKGTLHAAWVDEVVSRPHLWPDHNHHNVAAVVGLWGNAGQANYAASKAGLIGFTKSVAKELASRGVTANVIAPGFIETDMTSELKEETREAARAHIPLGEFGQPADIAASAVFLAGPGGGYITGQVLTVDGGMVM